MFGVVAVTNAFLPALRRSARPRIVNISSGTGSLAWSTGPEPQFPPLGGGRRLPVLEDGPERADRVLRPGAGRRGFKVNALAPGLRATDLNARAAASDGDPAEAAEGAVRLALLEDDGPTGEFLSWDGTAMPW